MCAGHYSWIAVVLQRGVLGDPSSISGLPVALRTAAASGEQILDFANRLPVDLHSSERNKLLQMDEKSWLLCRT